MHTLRVCVYTYTNIYTLRLALTLGSFLSLTLFEYYRLLSNILSASCWTLLHYLKCQKLLTWHQSSQRSEEQCSLPGWVFPPLADENKRWCKIWKLLVLWKRSHNTPSIEIIQRAQWRWLHIFIALYYGNIVLSMFVQTVLVHVWKRTPTCQPTCKWWKN